MAAIDNLYEVLKSNVDQELNTEEIARKVGLSRSVVSGYLAQLYKKNLVTKTTGRPVYWKALKPRTPFSDLIGYDDSLKLNIEKAMQSIVYPPNGFPVIITGPSGVGKSFLAKKIYEEAVFLGKIDKDSPFVTLNTADYANNTDLLSSVLFGYKKGAFTGAEKDMPGLLDKANNGYLFLDEVHRLSKTNQEKLFSVFDNGTFYPLGEVNKPHHVNIRLIFATTEDISNYLLKTFLRRIPMRIELSSYKERPLYERIRIVLHCLQTEAQKSNVTYLISPNKISEIANQDYPGNIGQVANNIKMLCSKGFTENEDKKEIPLEKDLSIEKAIKVDKNFGINNFNIISASVFDELEHAQDKLIEALKQGKTIDDCQLIDFNYLRKIKNFSDSAVNKVVVPHLKNTINKTLKETYGVNLSLNENIIFQLSFAFSLGKFQTKLFKNTDKFLRLIKHKYPRSFYLYTKFLEKITPKPTDSDYLWFFIMFANVAKKIEEVEYSCILLAHGTSTANSIQKVVNNLVNNYIFEAFDMPIDASVNDINKKVKEYLEKQNAHDKGILLIFDMGSLNQMFTKIKKSSNKQLLVINNLTTSIALDIAMRVERKEQFNEIAEKAEKYGRYMGIQYYEGLSNKRNIIVSCLSGVGLSSAIKKIIQTTLSTNRQIITMNYRKLRTIVDNNNESFFKNTDLIVTTTDFKTKLSLPIINIYNVLDKVGFNQLKSDLLEMGEDSKNIDNLMEKLLEFLTIEGIKGRLQFLNPNIVINEVQSVVQKYQDYYNVGFSGKLKLNLYMHLSLMIERVLLDQGQGQRTDFKINDKQREFYSVSKTIFKPIEMKYNIDITEFEISLLYELLADFI